MLAGELLLLQLELLEFVNVGWFLPPWCLIGLASEIVGAGWHLWLGNVHLVLQGLLGGDEVERALPRG